LDILKIISYLIIPRQIDLLGTFLLSAILFLGIYLAYSTNLLFEIKKKKVFRKKERKSIKKYILSSLKAKTVKNYNMAPIKISGNVLPIEKFTIIVIIISIFIAIFFSLTLKLSFFITMVVGAILSLLLVDKIAFYRYNKLKKANEACFEQAGLVIATGSAQKKELEDIYEDVINLQKYPISEEFYLMKLEYKKYDSHKYAFKLLKERYSDSMFIPRISDFLKVYEDEKKDITDIIKVNTKQAHGFVVNKKESENAVKPFISSIYVVLGIVYTFFAVSLFMSEATLKYYKNNPGMFVLLNTLILGGVYVLNYMKLSIVKDETMQRIRED
jgi:hypothetical protein